MSVQAEPAGSVFDTVKLVGAVTTLVGGIVGFYYFASYLLLYRVLGVLVAASLATALLYKTALGAKVWGFINESRTEIRKVVWPTRQETMQATMMVVALVFLVGLFLWLLDMVLFWGVGIITGQKV